MPRALSGPCSAKWDIRTGSPRKLWRTLHDCLDEGGFEHDYQELKFVESPIEGTATFSDGMVGSADHERRASLWLARTLLGVALCLTILLIPAGLMLIRSRVVSVRTIARVGVEGEVYRTRGGGMTATRAQEVLDVAADVRVILEVRAGVPGEGVYDIGREVGGGDDLTRLRHTFGELRDGLQGRLLPAAYPSTALQEPNTGLMK
jgi:hypothetical protein